MKMTITKDLINWPECKFKSSGKETFNEVAQRLRELDKPDCVWTEKQAFSGWKYFHPSCILMADSGALPTKKNRYCQHCGGAVKEAT